MSASRWRWSLRESRYIAEDAAELVEIEYAPLEAVIDPLAACAKRSAAPASAKPRPTKSHVREFAYGDTKSAFARADHRIAADGDVSAPVVHADGMLRRRRPAQSGQGQLRRAGEFPGAVFDASGDGAGAARAGAEIAAAHPAGFRRQLRHQAFGVSLCGADRACRENHRPAGQMGRGPHRASGRRKLRPEPRHRDRSRGDQRRPHSRAEARSARGLRRVPARADAGPALSHARRGDRRLRHRQCRRDQPRACSPTKCRRASFAASAGRSFIWRWSG